MFDTGQMLLPISAQKALLVSDSEWGLEELEGLLKTLGGEAVEKVLLSPIRKINPGTYLGAGKLEELKNILEAKEIDILLLDFDLSASQFKAISLITKKLVLDRSGIILEIFNRHARTKESKMQVELARLQYLMPRLVNLWSHFERQRGSGGGALKGKGMGEKQVEVDRRLVKDRMTAIRKKLKEVEKVRDQHRRARETVMKVALVGYTNAGKSTLLNALTHSDVLVEDALFATLDATVRLLNPKSKPTILGIDTVGFIDRLPHDLVASFRSTLGEVLEADLLLHVLDASHPEVKRHFEVTMSVLKELEADTLPMMIVFNKMDLCKQSQLVKVWAASLSRELELKHTPLFISAHDKKGVEDLRSFILKFFENRMQVLEVLVPYEDGKTLSKIHEIATVESKKETEKGMFLRIKTLPEFIDQANLRRFSMNALNKRS